MLCWPMASTTTTATAALSSLALADASRQQAAVAPHCVRLPTLPPPPPYIASPGRARGGDAWKPTAYSRRIARNVAAMATGETQAEVATELPEIVKPIKDAWDSLDDKYAVTSLAVAVVVALWGSTGLISAIDRLPLVPGVLELVGIGYTGWFAYRNLVFEPDREALIEKIKGTYSEIIGNR